MHRVLLIGMVLMASTMTMALMMMMMMAKMIVDTH